MRRLTARGNSSSGTPQSYAVQRSKGDRHPDPLVVAHLGLVPQTRERGAGVDLGDLYTESGQNFTKLVLGCIESSQILQVNSTSTYSLESFRRDLHDALLCTVL